MKSIGTITGGVVMLFALLLFAGGASLYAQGPTETPGANPTSTSGSPSPAATPSGTASPNSNSSTSGTAACTNVATFISDISYADGTAVNLGETFTKTWRLHNRGTCTWGAGYNLVFVTGQALTSNTSVAVPETAPNATADISVSLTAPSSNGRVQGFWQMQGPDGKKFGPRVWVLVNVGANTTTASAAGTTSSTGGRTVTTVAPAAAPPLSATNSNLDDPARAFKFGTTIPNLSAGTAEWFQFDYDNAGNALPRPTVTIQLLNGVTNGLTFEVYSPERMVDGWSNNPPVGRGTDEVVVGCTTSTGTGPCTTNNLTWTGGFGLSATYYVRVINNTGATVAPQLIVGGPGLANCPSTTTATNSASASYRVQCAAPTAGAPIP